MYDDEFHTVTVETEGWGGQYIVHLYKEGVEEHLHVSRSGIQDLVESIVALSQATGEPGWVNGPPRKEN